MALTEVNSLGLKPVKTYVPLSFPFPIYEPTFENPATLEKQ